MYKLPVRPDEAVDCPTCGTTVNRFELTKDGCDYCDNERYIDNTLESM